jgi:hypothetical protein
MPPKLDFTRNHDLFLERIKVEKSFFIKKLRKYVYAHNKLYNFYFQFGYNGLFNRITAGWRTLPDFIIPGFAKCGTTSLYYYLAQHDSITGGRGKEMHYFSWGNNMGLNWYKSCFPIKKTGLSFEASTSYTTHPDAALRIKKQIPDCKIIMIFRNPIDRSFSEHHSAKRVGLEKFTFEECIEQDEERLHYYLEVQKDPDRFTPIKRPYYRPCISMSKYSRWIKPYLDIFEKDQILFLNFNDLVKNPQMVLDKIFSFLNVEKQKINDLKKQNTNQYSPMNPNTKLKLEEIFKEPNLELKKLTGIDFSTT